MKVYIASDHAGFELKKKVLSFLQEKGYETEDCGNNEVDPNDDYPDYISKAAQKVSIAPDNFGIVIGGSGQGEAIAANKFKHVRCALFYGPAVAQGEIDVTGAHSSNPYEIIHLARTHNNANMLSLSSRFLTTEQAQTAIELFLKTEFKNEERHQRRIDKIAGLEQ